MESVFCWAELCKSKLAGSLPWSPHLKPSLASARIANEGRLQWGAKASGVDSVGDFLQACSCLAAQLSSTSSTGIHAWQMNSRLCCALKPGWPTTRTLIEVVAHAQDEVWLLKVGNLSHQSSNSCLILHSFPAPITHLHIHAGYCRSLEKCALLLIALCAAASCEGSVAFGSCML